MGSWRGAQGRGERPPSRARARGAESSRGRGGDGIVFRVSYACRVLCVCVSEIRVPRDEKRVVSYSIRLGYRYSILSDI